MFDVEGDIEAVPGERQRITIERARSGPDSVVLPASALWTANDGTVAVTVVQDGGRRDIPVEVQLSANGRVAVRSLGEPLPVGARVLVGYRDAGSHGG